MAFPSPRGAPIVQAVLVAVVGLALVAAAWPAITTSRSAGDIPGNTPTQAIVVERTVPSSSDVETSSHSISCGGTSPTTKRCSRSSALHSTSIKIRIEVEPGYRGVVKYRLSSSTANLDWRCSYALAHVQDADCTNPSISGSFEEGQAVHLRGKTTIPGDGPLEQSYGLWEVGMENK